MSATTMTVTKKDIIERISERTGIRRPDVKIVVQEFLNEVIDELGLGHRLEFREFGVFEIRQRAARIAQNPKTLEPVPVPAKNTIKFKPGRRMKEAAESAPQIEMKPPRPPESPDPNDPNDPADPDNAGDDHDLS